MCLKFWCCFGPGLGQDEDYCGTHHHVVPPAKTMTTPHHHYPALAQRNDGGHYHHDHATGHNRAPPLHHHHQHPVAAEEDRKASNDLKRGHHGYAASAAYVYSGPRGATTVTQPTSNATVVVNDGEPGRRGGAHHFNFYPADHQSPTTTAATYNLHRSVR